MPTNKNAMTRYRILDELLSDKYHNYSINDLKEEVINRLLDMNVYSELKEEKHNDIISRRTIEKDIKYLEDPEGPFNVEIERYSVPYYDIDLQKDITKHCLRYHNTSFSIFKKEMSDDESYLLSQTLKLLGQFEGLPELDELNRMRTGLHKDDRQIVSFTRNPLENSNLFGQLFTTIANKQVIRLTYHTFSDLSNKKPIMLHPYLLKEYNRRWHLFGAADSNGKLLHFSLDQIDKVEPFPSQPYKPSDEKLAEFFEDIIGITLFDNEEVEKIFFWVNDQSKNYVATKPIHESQILYKSEYDTRLRAQYPMLKNGLFFSIECKKNYELIRELSSFGSNLLVLSPKHIQDSVVERIEEMHEAYSKLRK